MTKDKTKDEQKETKTFVKIYYPQIDRVVIGVDREDCDRQAQEILNPKKDK